VCDPWADASSGNSASVCNTTKSVRPVARCNGFKADVWKAGATCIANLAHRDKHVQCGDKVKSSTMESVKDGCVALKIEDETTEGEMTEDEIRNTDACYNLATALAEYY